MNIGCRTKLQIKFKLIMKSLVVGKSHRLNNKEKLTNFNSFLIIKLNKYKIYNF